jgi:hypothetical protein
MALFEYLSPILEGSRINIFVIIVEFQYKSVNKNIPFDFSTCIFLIALRPLKSNCSLS